MSLTRQGRTRIGWHVLGNQGRGWATDQPIPSLPLHAVQ